MDQLMTRFRQFKVIVTKHPLYIKYGVFLFPIVVLLTGILIILLITIPQTLKLIENNTTIDQIKQKKTAYQEKITTLNKIDATLYKSDLNDVLYILPNEKDIPSAINSVLDLLASSGLTLTNFSLGASLPPQNGVESFGVSIEVTGTLEQLKNLISLSEKSSRLVKIVALKINNSNTSTQTTVDLQIFYAPLDLTVSLDPDQPISLLTDEEKQTLSNIKQNIATIAPMTEETITNTPTGKEDPFN